MVKKNVLILIFVFFTAAQAENDSIRPKPATPENVATKNVAPNNLTPILSTAAPLPLYMHAAIGLTANIIEKPIGHPLGFIQNRIMSEKSVLKQGLTDTQHVRRLYRGLPLSLSTSGPSTALEFTTNALMKNALAPNRKPTKAEQFVASGSAGVVSAFLDTPVECTLLAQQEKEQNFSTTVKEIAAAKPKGATSHAQAIRNFYRGLTPTIARNSLGVAGNLACMPICYDLLKEYIPNNVACMTTSAITTGATVATITHPLTFIKTQLQGDLERKKYKNSFDVIKKMYAQKGLGAFFKAYWPRTTRYCIGAAIYKKTYDTLTDLSSDKLPKSTSLPKRLAPQSQESHNTQSARTAFNKLESYLYSICNHFNRPKATGTTQKPTPQIYFPTH